MIQDGRISGGCLSQEYGYDPYRLAEALRSSVRAWHVDSQQPVVDIQSEEEGYSFLFMPHSLPAQSQTRDDWEKEILAFEFSTEDICRFEQEEKEFNDAFEDERREDARRDLEQAERRLELIEGGDDQFDSVIERAKRDDARERLRKLDIEDANKSLKHWEGIKAETSYEEEVRDWNVKNAMEVLGSERPERVIVPPSLFMGRAPAVVKNDMKKKGYCNEVIAYILRYEMGVAKTQIGEWFDPDYPNCERTDRTYRNRVDDLLKRAKKMPIAIEDPSVE